MKKKKKSKGFFRENYFSSWNYLKESKNYIYLSVGIFFFFALVGFFVPPPEAISQQILKFIEDLLNATQGMSQIELINYIFWNNLQSSFFGIFFGIFLGIFPIISAIGNGYLLGFVAAVVSQEESLLVLWRLLPHGIFELPAVFISFGLGLKLGTFIFQKEKMRTFNRYFWNSIKVFFFIVVPLLIVAAIIEGSLIVLLG